MFHGSGLTGIERGASESTGTGGRAGPAGASALSVVCCAGGSWGRGGRGVGCRGGGLGSRRG
jgi:hypothetical protein